VVVGIDGSRASLNAARWAVAEAVQRDAVLRLIHVVSRVRIGMCPSECELPDADTTLLIAEDVVMDVGRAVRVELARKVGDPAEVLIAESCCAEMICIGESTPYPATGTLFGSTARALLEHARCPVAVIRTDSDGSLRDGGVVSVVLDDEPDSDARVHLAMQEGRLRKATVRQIDRRVNSWIRRYPDVPVEVVASGTGRQYRRGEHEEVGVQLAVVGESDAADVTTLAVPNSHPIPGYPDCSVLMVRKSPGRRRQSEVTANAATHSTTTPVVTQ
jgi:nucleotide-binding universal stress UspA family protein